MEKTSLKILILGSTGMIGHKIFQVLSKNRNFQLFNASRSILNTDTKIVDLSDMSQVEGLLEDVKPDVVVNAAGLLIEKSESQPLDAVLLNAVLPLSLNSFSKKLGFRLIQISTDCVFSGDCGPYQVSDIKDAKTVYGRAKALGEIIDLTNLTIRTSVIGPDLKIDGKELFNWFMRQSGSVQGFCKSIWSGVTTLELAKCIEYCIVYKVGGIHHLSSREAISKYDLLSLLNDFSMNVVNLEKVDGPVTNKVLLPDNNVVFPINKSYRVLVEEMVNDIVDTQQYPHYRFPKDSN